MKRILFIAMFALAASAASAQYADLYYHRVGDTIEQNPNNGYFLWWDWDRTLQTDEVVNIQWFEPSKISLMRFETDVPLKVVGIAGIVSAWTDLTGGQHTDSTAFQEYFMLYEADSTGVNFKGQLPWRLRDPHRYVHITANGLNYVYYDSCCKHMPNDTVLPIYEYYFDSAITVYDSFYVGGTCYSRYNAITFSNQDYQTTYLFTNYHWNSSSFDCKGIGIDWGYIWCESQPVNYYLVDWVYNIDGEVIDTMYAWTPAINDRHLLVYPIVEMDTTVPPPDMCVALGNVQASISADGCLTVSWDQWPNYTVVQMRHGPITVPQNQWDTAEVTGTTYTVCGLDSAMGTYGYSLRALCAGARDTMEWTTLQWLPLTGVSSIEHPEPSPLAASVALAPNPASGEVLVTSQHYMTRIEMYNSRGILVYSEPTSGHEHRLSLEGLPAGSYIVSVQTTAGSTAKRLAVQ